MLEELKPQTAVSALSNVSMIQDNTVNFTTITKPKENNSNKPKVIDFHSGESSNIIDDIPNTPPPLFGIPKPSLLFDDKITASTNANTNDRYIEDDQSDSFNNLNYINNDKLLKIDANNAMSFSKYRFSKDNYDNLLGLIETDISFVSIHDDEDGVSRKDNISTSTKMLNTNNSNYDYSTHNIKNGDGDNMISIQKPIEIEQQTTCNTFENKEKLTSPTNVITAPTTSKIMETAAKATKIPHVKSSIHDDGFRNSTTNIRNRSSDRSYDKPEPGKKRRGAVDKDDTIEEHKMLMQKIMNDSNITPIYILKDHNHAASLSRESHTDKSKSTTAINAKNRKDVKTPIKPSVLINGSDKCDTIAPDKTIPTYTILRQRKKSEPEPEPEPEQCIVRNIIDSKTNSSSIDKNDLIQKNVLSNKTDIIDNDKNRTIDSNEKEENKDKSSVSFHNTSHDSKNDTTILKEQQKQYFEMTKTDYLNNKRSKKYEKTLIRSINKQNKKDNNKNSITPGTQNYSSYTTNSEITIGSNGTRTSEDSKKNWKRYRCRFCGEVKQNHVCKALLEVAPKDHNCDQTDLRITVGYGSTCKNDSNKGDLGIQVYPTYLTNDGLYKFLSISSKGSMGYPPPPPSSTEQLKNKISKDNRPSIILNDGTVVVPDAYVDKNKKSFINKYAFSNDRILKDNNINHIKDNMVSFKDLETNTSLSSSEAVHHYNDIDISSNTSDSNQHRNPTLGNLFQMHLVKNIAPSLQKTKNDLRNTNNCAFKNENGNSNNLLSSSSSSCFPLENNNNNNNYTNDNYNSNNDYNNNNYNDNFFNNYNNQMRMIMDINENGGRNKNTFHTNNPVSSLGNTMVSDDTDTNNNISTMNSQNINMNTNINAAENIGVNLMGNNNNLNMHRDSNMNINSNMNMGRHSSNMYMSPCMNNMDYHNNFGMMNCNHIPIFHDPTYTFPSV